MGAAAAVLRRGPCGLQIIALVGKRGEYGHTVCPYSPSTRDNIDLNPTGDRYMFEENTFNRRHFLAIAAMTLAAPQLGMI